VSQLPEHPQVSSLRREYVHGSLSRKQLLYCPVAQFECWLQQVNDDEL